MRGHRQRCSWNFSATVVACAIGCVFGASAQAAPTPSSLVSAEEQALIALLRQEKFIRARELAEKLLAKRPDSIVARFAMASVYHDEEGNLPRALYHAQKAERLLVQRFGSAPKDQEAQDLHREILLAQEALLGEMDQREAQLALIERYDRLYKPKLDHRRVWALMKLSRFDEAQKLARAAARSDELPLRISGLNGEIAIEMERKRPKGCYETGLKAVQLTGEQSCILLHNTAEAAFAVFKFEKAEEYARKALKAPMKDCPNSSYTHLASLYLLRGDFQRAMEAVRSARSEGVRRRYRQQFEMENNGWLFRLLYALGKFDDATPIAERVLRAPDRVGMTSLSNDLTRLVGVLEYHAALAARQEQLRELRSARPLFAKLPLLYEQTLIKERAWSTRRRAARMIAEKVELADLLRPYLTPLTPWMTASLLPALGDGVVAEALKSARARETMPRETAPYFDALEGEIAFRAGKDAQAYALARGALGRLPKEELLLRGRVQAYAAAAAQRLGQTTTAESLFHEVLERYPTALRLLSVPLPARVIHDGKALSEDIARVLSGSPRLAIGGATSFVVRVLTDDTQARICLEGASGRRYACSTQDLRKTNRARERVTLAVDEFHEKVFAPKVDLTQRDINSLDGSAVRGTADELVDKVLGR